MNKNLTHLKNLLAVAFIAAGLMAFLAGIPGQAYAAPAPTPPPPSGSLSQDAQCTAGAKSCVPAACDPAIKSCPGKNCSGADNCNIVKNYINPLIALLSTLVGIAVVIGLIVGGIQYASAGGDPQKVSTAKRHIRNSIIALLTFFYLFALIKFLIPGGDLTG